MLSATCHPHSTHFIRINSNISNRVLIRCINNRCLWVGQRQRMGRRMVRLETKGIRPDIAHSRKIVVLVLIKVLVAIHRRTRTLLVNIIIINSNSSSNNRKSKSYYHRFRHKRVPLRNIFITIDIITIVDIQRLSRIILSMHQR